MEPDLKPSAAQEVVHKGKGCLATILAAAVLIVGGYLVYDRASTFASRFGAVEDYPGPGTGQVTVVVPEGSSVDAIGDVLLDSDVILSTDAWEEATEADTRATSIQPGRYVLQRQMRAADAMELLINPGTALVRTQFTIREGLRLTAQIDALVKETKIPKADFERALDDPDELGLPNYAKDKPEGFLFPETYDLPAEPTARSVLRSMVRQYKRVAADIDLEDRAEDLGVEPYDIVIVASIIEREVRRDADRAKVARVLYNRLDEGMELGLDSTVVYAENLKTNTTTARDRESDSPYNTYLVEGLPPGPISAPGTAALEAAANPADGDWLYFVTVNFDTGKTEFGETEADFEKLRAKFQKYCRDNPGTCDS